MVASRFLATHKHEPKLELSKLLKRRRMSLEQFISENCIASYAVLTQRCNMIGVTAPSEVEYNAVARKRGPITSQVDGIVVIAPSVLSHQNVEISNTENTENDEAPSTLTRKERRRLKKQTLEHTKEQEDVAQDSSSFDVLTQLTSYNGGDVNE